MLPVYLLYLAGEGLTDVSADRKKTRSRLLINTIFFVLGFATVFSAMGAGASFLSALLLENKELLTRIAGAYMIFIGLNYIGIIRLNIFNSGRAAKPKANGILASYLFGAAYTFGWTPCIGTFLSAALMLAASQDTILSGLLLLFCFSLGLGAPFILAAAFSTRIAPLVNFLKRHARAVEILCGTMLILFGASMLFGIFNYYMALFN